MSWIKNYYPEYKIIVPNIKLLSAECECESECDGNFYVANRNGNQNFAKISESLRVLNNLMVLHIFVI